MKIPRSESAFLWQDGRVHTATWRRDGAQIASGGHEPTVWVWDTTQPLPREPKWIRAQMKLTLPDEETMHVRNIEWSPDLTKLLVSDNLGGAHLWDANSGAYLRTFRAPGGAFVASWSADGARILVASQNAIRIHDVESGKTLREIRAPGAYLIAGFWNRDETRILAGSYNEPVTLHSTRRGAKPVHLAESKGVYWATWSADDTRVLFGASGAQPVACWDATTGERLRVYPDSEIDAAGTRSAEWSPDEKRIVLFSGMQLPRIVVCDAESGDVLSTGALRGHVFGIEWNATGRHYIAYGDGIQIRAPQSDAPVFELEPFTYTRTARWSPDGHRVVTGGDERCLRVWEFAVR